MADRLRVLAVPEVGWSDWGSVDRILASAKELGRLHEIAARLKHCKITDPSTKTIVTKFLDDTGGSGVLGSGLPKPSAGPSLSTRGTFL